MRKFSEVFESRTIDNLPDFEDIIILLENEKEYGGITNSTITKAL